MAAYVPGSSTDYASRVACLSERGVALWDVLAAATRVGSLDSAISADAVANNFRAFFNAYPRIELLCFNGATAQKLYRQYVTPTLDEGQRSIAQWVLPSTSPAHAAMTLAQKVKAWEVVWRRSARPDRCS